jgi:general nucleoside transport system permease protein
MLRLEPRLSAPGTAEWLARLAGGVVLALVAGVIVLALVGHDPLTAYGALLRGAFGSTRAWAATINKAVPIGLCALGIALAHRAGLWNIGAEGQLYFGAFAATGIGLALPPATPAGVALPLVLSAGLLAGGAWAALAALPRAYLGMNEILSTLMLNYVAILWVNYLVTGPWADPLTFSFPYSERLPDAARLGRLADGVHLGVVFLIAAGIILTAVDRGLRWGYDLRVSGNAPRAALYAGIAPVATIITGLVVAGAFAGLAGAIEVSASTGRLQAGLSPGYGFMAILVAWLGGGRPLSDRYRRAALRRPAERRLRLAGLGLPPAIGTILQAMLLLGVLVMLGLGRYRIRLVGTEGARA